MKKRLISILLAFAVVFSLAPVVAYASGTKVTVNGKEVFFTDAQPFVDSRSRTLVPLRPIADAMGLNVAWDEMNRQAVFYNFEGKGVIFEIDSTVAKTNTDQVIVMDTAAMIKEGRTFAPARYLAEAFGYIVGWDAATSTVLIQSSEDKKEIITEKPQEELGKKDLTSKDYEYLAHVVFGSIKRDYPYAKAEYSYVYAFENMLGEECVLVDVWYDIGSRFDRFVLYNMSTGETIENPGDHYIRLAEGSYGAERNHYIDIGIETLEHCEKMLLALKSILQGYGNTYDGVYIDGSTLNF